MQKILKRQQSINKDDEISNLAHGYRVAELAVKISKAYRLPGEIIKNIYAAAIFHDIGKMAIDRNILNKPGKLSPDEKLIMNLHSELGAGIGRELGLNQSILDGILSHHESYDGSGYPNNLKGENIPICARIIKICDVYDALRTDRPYRTAFTILKALDIMDNEKQTFDPVLFNIFKEVLSVEN